MGVRVVQVRAPATLAGNNQQATTDSIKCFGARQVGFLVKATNANIIETQLMSVGNNNVNFNTGAAATVVHEASLVTGVRLDLGGIWAVLCLNSTATARSMFAMPWNYARLVLTTPAAGATPANDVTGLEVIAYCWDDDDFAQLGMGSIPLLPA